MNKQLRIAVLLFGQPRFINLTKKFLKEEFAYPNINFDIFSHYWKDVSFSKKSEGTYIDYTKEIDIANNILNPISCKIDTFDELDNFINNIENIINCINKNQYRILKENPIIKRYKWGQHFSLLKAFNLLKSYEKKNNITYDIVIKGRTDFVYRNNLCYKNEEEYLHNKFLNYLNFSSFTEPQAITTGCQYQQLSPVQDNPKTSKWVNVGVTDMFYYPTETWQRNENNIFRTGDISLCTNRLAAEKYFGEYLATYFNTFTNSLFKNNDIFVRHDAIQGDIAINNNIRVYRMKKCRFHRLVNSNDYKNGWENVVKNKTIMINDIIETTEQYIQDQLLYFAKKKLEPAPY